MAGTVAVIGVMALSFAALGGVGEALGKRDGGSENGGCPPAGCTTVTETRTRTATVEIVSTTTGSDTAIEKVRATTTSFRPTSTESQPNVTVTSTAVVPGSTDTATTTLTEHETSTMVDTVASTVTSTLVTLSTELTTRLHTVTVRTSVSVTSVLSCYYTSSSSPGGIDRIYGITSADPRGGEAQCPKAYVWGYD